MSVTVHSEIWVCVDCMLVHANGECGESPDCEPWSDVDPERFEVAMGGEHEDGCTARADGEDCECERQTFSRSQCEGCGSWLAGERYLFTLFVREA